MTLQDPARADSSASEAVPPGAPASRRLGRWGIAILAGLIFVTAFGSFVWPAYRAFLKVQIQGNEGWNAYYADAALGECRFIHRPSN